MEPDATTPIPAADAPAAPTPAPEESASGNPADAPQVTAAMNAMIRGELQQVAAGSSSHSDADVASAADADAADGEPAQPRDAKPASEQPGRRSRRAEEAAQRIAALEDENEQLKAQLAPTVPPDASEEARKAILDSEDRYRRLLAKPDDDPDWTQDDYSWLQDEKRKRALVPDLTRHFETVLERETRLAAEATEQEKRQFWDAVGRDLASAEELPGVDIEALKKAPTFADRDRLVYAAAKAANAAENRALREENADLKRQLLGVVRPPLNGGRSSPGRTYDAASVMNNLIRNARA